MMKMGNEIALKEDQQYSVSTVVNRVKAVNDLYKQVMIKDQHYGVIPGTGTKPTLLKSGAEQILSLFQLAAKAEKTDVRDLPGGHREYIMTVGLYSRKDGSFWGDGSGSCSTMESKYRYRWQLAPYIPEKEEADHLKSEGKGKFKKVDNEWKWFERVENQDIADVYNTVLKMADKRALICAVLKAAGVSDIFTQDIEDMVENEQAGGTPVGAGGGQQRLDFEALKKELAQIHNKKDLAGHMLALGKKFPNITPKQKGAVKGIYKARSEEMDAESNGGEIAPEDAPPIDMDASFVDEG
jgi:hypothetical protein